LGDLGMIGDFISQSGGHIEVSSEAGHGTAVKIDLPRAVVVIQSPAEYPGEGGVVPF
jgi:signal transduction histidine kinase